MLSLEYAVGTHGLRFVNLYLSLSLSVIKEYIILLKALYTYLFPKRKINEKEYHITWRKGKGGEREHHWNLKREHKRIVNLSHIPNKDI
jgi:hypothetical protein